MIDMDVIEAKFRIVTPMFISGADQTKAELRVPSIKGALRFWWRALNYKEDTKALFQEESEIFGNTDKQSKIKISLKENEFEFIEIGNTLMNNPNMVIGEGARYLGYGLMGAFGKSAGILERPCIKNHSETIMRISCSSEIREKIIAPLKLFGIIGGIGSRSRRGYGSISIENILINGEVDYNIPKNIEDMKIIINNLIGNNIHKGLPKYTAFSKNTRMIIANSGKNPLEILDDIGKEMMRYRSWGHNGKVLGIDSEKNFKDDHDWSKNPDYYSNFHPRRIVFGLPQNYSKHLDCKPEKYNRRASPLFIHIGMTKDEKYHGIITIFESLFLPENELIIAGRNHVKQQIEYKVLHEFLDRFNGVNLLEVM